MSNLEEIGFDGLAKRFNHIDDALEFLKTVKTAQGESIAADAIFYLIAVDSEGNFSKTEAGLLLQREIRWVAGGEE